MPILNQVHNGNKKVLYQDHCIRIIQDLRKPEDRKEDHKYSSNPRYQDIIVETHVGNDNLGNQIWYEVCCPASGDHFIQSYHRLLNALVFCCKQKDDELNESAA